MTEINFCMAFPCRISAIFDLISQFQPEFCVVIFLGIHNYYQAGEQSSHEKNNTCKKNVGNIAKWVEFEGIYIDWAWTCVSFNLCMVLGARRERGWEEGNEACQYEVKLCVYSQLPCPTFTNMYILPPQHLDLWAMGLPILPTCCRQCIVLYYCMYYNTVAAEQWWC